MENRTKYNTPLNVPVGYLNILFRSYTFMKYGSHHTEPLWVRCCVQHCVLSLLRKFMPSYLGKKARPTYLYFTFYSNLLFILRVWFYRMHFWCILSWQDVGNAACVCSCLHKSSLKIKE